MIGFDMNCIFCDIVAGKSPCHKVWEDAEHLAFLSIYPNTQGFTVVIPKRHHSSYLFAQDDDVVAAICVASKKVALLLDKALDGVARTGMVFEGYEVDHLHSKLIPMHGTGDDAAFQPINGQAGPFISKYPGFLSTHDCERADDAELAKLAAYIRSCA